MPDREKDKRFFETVANYYDGQQEDINLLLGAADGIIHHHSGICGPGSTFSNPSEGDLLKELHRQENALTERGVAQLGEVTSQMRGLDAGCGRGGSSMIIHRQFRCEMNGITLSAYQASFANQIAREIGLGERVKFYQANMLDLPFEDGAFDFIWACESTEHIPDLGDMFSEFRRVTKPGCKLVIITGCGNPDHPEGQKYIEMINSWYRIKIHAAREYLDGAEGNGWKIIANVDLTPETIPYWDLRVRSAHKTGVEKLSDAYKNGVGEYRLFTFQKQD